MKPPIIIRGHLGLGDHLIMNGLVWYYASLHRQVFLPCKAHNYASVCKMFDNDPTIVVLPVKDDEGADQIVSALKCDQLLLGAFGKDFSFVQWDKKFYEQAGVPFKQRWEGFQFGVCQQQEHPKKPYAFLHEAPSRNYIIDRNRAGGLPLVQPTLTDTIFDWVFAIKNAKEIHCIDSSFAILADLIETKATVLKLHLYARPGAKPPTYKKNWEILTK